MWTESGPRLCDALLESYPPQCGNPSVPIVNPEVLDLEFQNAYGVWWSNYWTEIEGDFDGESFTVDSTADPFQPTEAELDKAIALVAFARALDGATVANIGFAEEVTLGLGDRLTYTVVADTLEDPDGWLLNVDEYDGYVGPFSALNLLRAPFEVTVGPHARCVAPPTAAPEGMATYRQLSIQTTGATSCLEWWAVDLYLNPNGEIAALVLDLYGP